MDEQAALGYFPTLNDVGIPLIVFEYHPWSDCHYSTQTGLELAEISDVVAVTDGSGNVTAYSQH